MTDQFDLEQAIIQCWQITEDIPMLEEQGASTADMVSLACVYEFRFKKLWEIFETLVHDRRFKQEDEG
jgi:hypothetical protein